MKFIILPDLWLLYSIWFYENTLDLNIGLNRIELISEL